MMVAHVHFREVNEKKKIEKCVVTESQHCSVDFAIGDFKRYKERYRKKNVMCAQIAIYCLLGISMHLVNSAKVNQCQ